EAELDALRPAGGHRPTPGRPEGARRPAVRGWAHHRPGAHLLAGRRGPGLLRAQGWAVIIRWAPARPTPAMSLRNATVPAQHRQPRTPTSRRSAQTRWPTAVGDMLAAGGQLLCPSASPGPPGSPGRAPEILPARSHRAR